VLAVCGKTILAKHVTKAARRPSVPRPLPTLPQGLIAELGKRPDAELAQQFGVRVEAVRRERYQRGLRDVRRRLCWTGQEVALLGTASDATVAARLGVTRTAVEQQRRARGIPAFAPSRGAKRHRWTKQQLAWLGRVPDGEIAKRIGRAPACVRFKRLSLGIGCAQPGRRRRSWSADELALLGTLPDAEIARRIGMHRHHVSLKRRELKIANPLVERAGVRWTKEVVARLGKEPDRRIAEQVGVPAATVAGYRRRHYIPSCAERQGTLGNRRGPWSPERVAALGEVPDAVLAEQWGISRQAVAFQRKRRGIAAYSLTGGTAPAGSEAPRAGRRRAGRQ
jgi:hypothetical protein